MKPVNTTVAKVVDILFDQGKAHDYWVPEESVSTYMELVDLDESHHDEVCRRLEDAGISVGAKRKGVIPAEPIHLPENISEGARILCQDYVGKYPTLDESEEDSLARKGETNLKARELLICSNRHLALSFAFRHSKGGKKANTSDLFLWALAALDRAAVQYDPDCGTRFSAYAEKEINKSFLSFCLTRRRIKKVNTRAIGLGKTNRIGRCIIKRGKGRKTPRCGGIKRNSHVTTFRVYPKDFPKVKA